MVQLVVECHDDDSGGAAFTQSADLSVLDDPARREVAALVGREFVYLQLYLVEGEEHTAADQPVSPVTLRDVERDPALAAPFWVGFAQWFAQRTELWMVLLNDILWDETHGWQDLASVAASGRLVSNLNLKPTSRPGVFAANPTPIALEQLVGGWWPSRAGGLAGISLTPAGDQELLHRLGRAASVRAADVERISVMFETSKQFENLGLDLLVRSQNCRTVLEELAGFGLS